MLLTNGETVVVVRRYPRLIRRDDMSVLGYAGNLPDGYRVDDYFDGDGNYKGPDVDGVEPAWTVLTDDSIEVEMGAPTGPHVTSFMAVDAMEQAEIDAEAINEAIPAGWRVAWENGIQLNDGRWQWPLVEA